MHFRLRNDLLCVAGNLKKTLFTQLLLVGLLGGFLRISDQSSHMQLRTVFTHDCKTRRYLTCRLSNYQKGTSYGSERSCGRRAQNIGRAVSL